jgi:hypothetical protein
MSQRTLKIIVVLIILISGNDLAAQNFDQHSTFTRVSQGKLYPENLDYSSSTVDKLWINFTLFNKTTLASSLYQQPVSGNSLYQLPADFSVKCLGFFCKQELKIDQHTLLPVRLRLGSLDYVNWMEQKPNAVITGKNH